MEEEYDAWATNVWRRRRSADVIKDNENLAGNAITVETERVAEVSGQPLRDGCRKFIFIGPLIFAVIATDRICRIISPLASSS